MTYSPMTSHSALPDPDLQPAFYDGVTTKRAIAWVIDMIIVGIVTVIFGFFTFFVGFFFFPVVFLTVTVVYRIGTLATGSATWGMRFVGIQIRNAGGHHLSGTEAALHTLFYLVSVAFFLPQIVSWGMMIFGGRGQGLHDFLLGSAAINRPR
jgi:uncharacterized RDD family membrane protein YckC